MQVQFLCECGQAIRTEQGEGPLSVQCPTCGKVLTVAGTAGPLYPAAWRAAPPPPAGISVTAMVLGICGVVPGLGVLTAPVGIVLGIIALAKKRRGRGFAIAGIAAGAGGLLTVQLLTGGYVLFIVMMLSRLGAMGTRMAMTPMTMPALAPTTIDLDLDDPQIQEMLLVPPPTPQGPAAAPWDLAKAHKLFPVRHNKPGDLFLCVRAYLEYVSHNGVGKCAQPADERDYETAWKELLAEVGEAMARARSLELKAQIGIPRGGLAVDPPPAGSDASARWRAAADAYGKLIDIVPLKENPIHMKAVVRKEVCEAMASGGAATMEEAEAATTSPSVAPGPRLRISVRPVPAPRPALPPPPARVLPRQGARIVDVAPATRPAGPERE